MKIINKNVPASYNILEKIEAGIVLLGSEVKAIKTGHADLTGSYAKIMGSEAYLVNASIFPYQYSRIENYDERRTRKLLLHKGEIIALKSRLEQGPLTLIPLSMRLSDNLIKVELALTKGKRRFQKKRTLRERDLQREAEAELKDMGKI